MFSMGVPFNELPAVWAKAGREKPETEAPTASKTCLLFNMIVGPMERGG